ncbi:pyridoxamine 5'-phosphate oxidase family protein [Staphylococcus succinus]|uniref:pyridoxamine 5'-phosphate oxidase family protein n=1 Tax=Staphylococcus succinus TaxID=61015 RepID=UPI000E683B01|nr:pyridoxamine 5'-phosphate oxidase family protein [Staphylococcus succinus]RIN29399.1 pyridoxamine 5'-phosphate oxidase family protein [Staphylococcus succinus]
MNLPKEIIELLNGQDLEDKKHLVMMLQSITAEGYPHTAMVSVGEIVAIDSDNIRIALWPDTQTAQRLVETGKGSLVIVYAKKIYYIELDLSVLPGLNNEIYCRLRFEASVKTVKEDKAKYAEIISGVSIQLYDAENVVERWKVTVKELLDA